MNSKEMEQRCNAIIVELSNQAKTDQLFQNAKKVIDTVSGGDLTQG